MAETISAEPLPGSAGRICVSLAEPTPARLLARITESPPGDVVELRLDALEPSIREDDGAVAALIAACPRPAVVTCRSAEVGEEGSARREFLLELALRCGAWAVDVELDAPFAQRLVTAHRPRVIVSHHWTDARPRDLEDVAARAAALRPAIVKLVAPAAVPADAAPVLEAGRRLRSGGQPAATFCLGEGGRSSRLLDFAAGGALTYVAGSGGVATAPGQWMVDWVHRDLRPDGWRAGAPRYGLLGDPITHSLSPAIFNLAFALDGSGRAYIPVTGGDFAQALKLADAAGLAGLSVTMPFKQEALAACFPDEFAARIGAVNTLSCDGDAWRGHNTDGPAVVEVLGRHLSLPGARVLVLGAGGAARAAAIALIDAGARVVVSNRTSGRADELARGLGTDVVPWDRVMGSTADAIVNATSLGMEATADNGFPTFRLSGAEVAMEMVYRPVDTPLLRQARASGCTPIEGLEMFLVQAAGQFRIWTGEEPPLPAWRMAAQQRLDAERES